MDTTIEQLRYEEPSAKFCVEGIIDDHGVGFVDYFNFERKRKSSSSSKFDNTTISSAAWGKKSLVPEINATTFELQSLFSLNGANFLWFVFLGHNVDKKMEHKFEKMSLHICPNYHVLGWPAHFYSFLYILLQICRGNPDYIVSPSFWFNFQRYYL